MTQKPDGGPAFPGTASEPNERGVFYPVHHQGMSLRDWFAGQALAVLVTLDADCGPLGLAKDAYAMADAMLAARAQTEGEQ